MNKEFRVWMVRAGQGGYLIEDFLEEEIVAIGWNELGRIDEKITYPQLKELYRTSYPDDGDGRVNQCVGQIWRFFNEFNVGDKVVTYDPLTRVYFLGEIKSNYLYNTVLEFFHSRKVSWMDNGVDRDVLSTDTKNSLGGISTIFELTEDIWEELLQNHPGYISEELQLEIEEVRKFGEEDELRRLKDDVIFRSKEFIKDIISNLSWQDTEILAAGLLRALGYKTKFTSQGSDLGSDILASPDELFLEEPRIKVEVKKRKEKIGAPDIRNFLGGMRGNHKGIYISISGFSKDAKYEAERANFAITLIDSDWLVELIISNYETLDPEIKAIVPLRKIYWPV